MQGLAQDHALSSFDPSVQLESIQRLQEEWRKLGRLAPKIEQELWGKFQTASQQAYAPCKAHFENQAQTREHNKRHRELMCRQLTDYIAHSDWSNADWPSVQDTLKHAREEWRRFSPVDRKHQKALDEQFSGLLEQISTRLDAFKLANEAIKQQLLEQAEVLVEQEISFALKQMQALREQWRQVGLLPARSYKAMNDRFTKLYTLLNERKQQQLSDSNEQRKHNAEQISQALEKLEQLLSGSNESILARQQDISHTEQLFAECTPISEPQRSALRHRFEQLKAEFATALIYSQQKAKQQALQVFANISQFLRTIETKGLLAELRPAELEAIKMHWSKLPEPKGLATASLKARFDAVINTVNQQDNTPLVTASELASVRAREICVAMEILAQLESPEEDAELRMQMQVDRLNQALQGAQIESFKWNESERLALDWYNTGPLPPELKTVFETRISSAMQHTLGATFEQHGSVSNDQNEPCVMQASGPY